MVNVSLFKRCVPTFSVTPEIGIYTSLIRAGSLSHYCLDQKGATVVVSLPLYSSYSVWTPKGGDTSDETVHRCILPRGRYNDNFAIHCNRNIIVKWSIVFYIFVVVANTQCFVGLFLSCLSLLKTAVSPSLGTTTQQTQVPLSLNTVCAAALVLRCYLITMQTTYTLY